MAVVDFSVNTINMWAEILGTEIEITHFESDFELNSIPTATISCAIGRDCTTLEAASIHALIDNLAINVPILVWAEIVEIGNSGVPSEDWPGGPFIVFDGLVVGSGFDKSQQGSASLMLSCRHWLMDLEYAVTCTNETHPVNPGDNKMKAGLKIGAGNPNFAVGTIANKIFTRASIEEDLWGSCFQPWLAEVIELPVVFQGEDIGNLQGATDAEAALNRIEPFGMLLPGVNNYFYGVPLALDQSFQVLQLDPAIEAIANHVSMQTIESFYGQTFWEKLVAGYAPHYLFAVVPMVSRALIVPFIPGLRPTYLTIDPSEYESLGLRGTLSRGLGGVVIQTGMMSMCGAWGFQQGQPNAINKIGGIFENPNMPKGMIIFREGPNWLVNNAMAAAWGNGAAAAHGIKGDQRFPGVGIVPALAQPGEVRAQAANLWDEYARGVYLYEALKLRRGGIVGKVRFDVAPGSSVEIITTEEKFVAQQTGIADQSLFGMVTKVKTIIDSEAPSGQTIIEIGYLADEIEHVDPALSTIAHPLYSTVWLGAPLVDGFAPGATPIPVV